MRDHDEDMPVREDHTIYLIGLPALMFVVGLVIIYFLKTGAISL